MVTVLPISTKSNTMRKIQLDFRSLIGGVNKLASPFDIREDEVQGAQNVLFDEEIGAVVSREGSKGLSDIGSAAYDSDLKCYLKLDENTGATAQDSTANNHDGTVDGTWTDYGKFNSGVIINAAGKEITIGDHNDLDFTTVFSLLAWVKMISTADPHHVIGKSGGANTPFPYLVFIASNKVYFTVYDASSNQGRIISSAIIPNDVWVHIACIFDNGNMRIYINGVLNVQDNVTPTTLRTDSNDVLVGNNNGGTVNLNGTVDEVQLWATNLDENEIKQYMSFGGTYYIMKTYNFTLANGTNYIFAQRNDGTIYYTTDLTNWTQLQESDMATSPSGLSNVDLTDDTECCFESFENVLWITNGVDVPRFWDGTYCWVLDPSLAADGTTWGDQHAPSGVAKAPPGQATTDEVLDMVTTDKKGAIILKMNERLHMLNTPGEPGGDYFSRPYDDAGADILAYDEVAFPDTNLIRVGGAGGAPITGAIYYKGMLTIFKEKELHVIRQTGPLDADFAQLQIPTAGKGTLYNKSIAIFKKALLFLANDGIYSFNGNFIDNISRNLQPVIDTLQQSLVRVLNWIHNLQAEWDGGTYSDVRGDMALYPGSVVLVENTSTKNIDNNGFETDTDWEESDKASDRNYDPTLLGLTAKAGSKVGITHSNSSFKGHGETEFARARIYNENDTLLETFDILPSNEDTWTQATLDLSAYDETKIKIKLEGGVAGGYFNSPGSLESALFICNGGSMTLWVMEHWTTPDAWNKQTYSILFDLVEEGVYRYKSSGNWVSENRNLGTVGLWGVFTASQDKNGETLDLFIETASSEAGLNGTGWTLVEHGEAPIGQSTETNTWCRFKAEFATDDDEVSPILDSIKIQYYRSATQAQSAEAIVFDGRFLLTCARENETKNNLIIVIDNNSALVPFVGWGIGSFVEFENQLYAGSGSSIKLYQLFTGDTDDRVVIDAWFIPRRITFFYQFMQLLKYFVTAERNLITDTINVDYRFNGGSWTTRAITLSGNIQDTYRINPAFGARGKFLDIRVRNNTDLVAMKALGVTLIVSPHGEI